MARTIRIVLRTGLLERIRVNNISLFASRFIKNVGGGGRCNLESLRPETVWPESLRNMKYAGAFFS